MSAQIQDLLAQLEAVPFPTRDFNLVIPELAEASHLVLDAQLRAPAMFFYCWQSGFEVED